MPSQKKITSRCPGLGAFTAHVSLLQFPVRCADWYIEQNVVADALSQTKKSTTSFKCYKKLEFLLRKRLGLTGYAA